MRGGWLVVEEGRGLCGYEMGELFPHGLVIIIWLLLMFCVRVKIRVKEESKGMQKVG